MRKFILTVILFSLTVLTLGCSGANIFSDNDSGRSKILRQSMIAANYQMYQLEVTLNSGGELPIILELSDGGKAEGYFYVESGDDNITFDIVAANDIYRSDFEDLPKDVPVSDRFSFTASTTQGRSYVMTLRNTSDVEMKSKSTIFFEVLYSGNRPIFTPLTK